MPRHCRCGVGSTREVERRKRCQRVSSRNATTGTVESHGTSPLMCTSSLPEIARLVLQALRDHAGHGVDRRVHRERQPQRLVPAFGGVQLLDEARGVFRHQHPHAAQRRAEPGAVERPHRNGDGGERAVEGERRQPARQRPALSRRRRGIAQPFGRGREQVGEHERQERHQQHAGRGELVEDHGQHDERHDQRRRAEIDARAPALAGAGRLPPRQIGLDVGARASGAPPDCRCSAAAAGVAAGSSHGRFQSDRSPDPL